MAGSLSGRIAAVTGGDGRDVAFAASVIDAGEQLHPFLPYGDHVCLRTAIARHDVSSRTDCA